MNRLRLQALPDEILHLILSYSLPHISQDTFANRYNRLLSYSTLGRSLARIAQQLLVQHVQLDNDIDIIQFIIAVDECVGVRRVVNSKCISLRFDGAKVQKCSHYLGQVLKSCPGVKEVWIRNAQGKLLALSVMTELEQLHLDNVELVTESPTSKLPEQFLIYLPSLRTLSLNSFSLLDPSEKNFEPLDAFFLRSPSLPKLTHLSYTWHAEFHSDPEFVTLTPQLSHLYLRRLFPPNSTSARAIAPLPDKVLADLSDKLRHLAIDILRRGDLDVLSRTLLPLSLRSMKITGSDEAAITKIERSVLEFGKEWFGNVGTLIVDAIGAEEDESSDDDDDEGNEERSGGSRYGMRGSSRLEGDRLVREANRSEAEKLSIELVEIPFDSPMDGWDVWLTVTEWIDDTEQLSGLEGDETTSGLNVAGN